MASLYSDLLYFSCLISWEHYTVSPMCSSIHHENSSRSIPEELAEVDLSELTAFLAEHSRGRLGRERAERIKRWP
jgi:hypothetical protein